MMQALRLKWVKNERGLTLIELLAVVVIIGIIAAIAIPMIIGGINNSKEKTDTANETMLIEAAMRYMMDSNITTSTASVNVDTDLVKKGYIKEVPVRQTATVAVAEIPGPPVIPAIPSVAAGKKFVSVDFKMVDKNWVFDKFTYN